MKKKLLLLAFFALVSLKSFSQVVAYPVADIVQCSNEVFNLTVQTPVTLANQSAAQYTVTYFTTPADAENNVNPIVNPEAFIINGNFIEQALYIRVQNNTTGEFATTSFVITMQGGINVPEYADVFTCGSFILPALAWPAQYYTGPNGTGTTLDSNFAITTTQTIYIYAASGVCTGQSSFNVTINGSGPSIAPPPPLVQCDLNGDNIEIFNLMPVYNDMLATQDVVSVTIHQNFLNAQNNVNPIVNLSAYTNMSWQMNQLYIRLQYANCVSLLPLTLLLEDCPTNNSFSGHVRFDNDGNGCNATDVPAAGVWVYYFFDSVSHYAQTDANGYYEFNNVPNGTSVVSALPTYAGLNVGSGFSVTFPGADPIDNDICITTPNPVQDVAVYLYPQTNAVAGFVANYVLIIHNNGTIPTSGTVTTQYDASHLTFIPAAGITQSGNTLTVAYTNLTPFSTQYYYFSALVAAPPALNFGDVITFTSVINPVTGDAYPQDNTYVMDQQIMNSFDPNDITVKEGEFITEEQADGCLHYMVRFQNTGNYQATNIKVEGILDDNLDWDTFEPLGASHVYHAFRDGGNMRFMFDGINLPDSTTNEAASHGFVAYRIKPKASVQLGDAMSAQVGIYFDFNTAVITNEVTTTIQALALATFNNDAFVVYPNPASAIVNLKLQNAVLANVAVTDVLGKTVATSSLNGNAGSLDISQLTSGIYFITLSADGKQITKKLVVK
jgi:hypothetical protein